MVLIGCALGIIILIIDSVLESKDSVLDFTLCLLLLVFICLLDFPLHSYRWNNAHFILSENKTKGEPDSILQRGILLSSGLIAGESLMGILLAFIAGAGIKNLNLNIDPNITSGLTFIIAIITIYWVYKQSKPKTLR